VAVLVVAILAGAALFLSGFSLGRQLATTPGTPPEEELFAPFWEAYRAVTEQYAGGEVDRKKLIEGAIKGMFEALGDPYSSYLTSEEYQRSLQDLSGQFEGIGAEIGTIDAAGRTSGCVALGPDCRLVIVAPLADSPAEKAGLLPGDVVVAVDGRTVDGLTIDEARDRIRGKKGTEVVLTIERGGERREISIVRDVIVQREVVVRELAGGTVGYIRLTAFSSNSAEQFHAALERFVAAGVKKLVIDLRGNPGGYTTAARDIASELIGSGPIFWQEDAHGNQIATEAKPGGLATDPAIRVVALVDRGTASAGEILAGALQDTGRATLVGQQTFGKGTVQQWSLLSDDAGGFRLTVAKWLTPNKRWIHGTGLTPDVVVEGTPSGPTDDPVLDKALELLGDATSRSWLGRRAA
jgi:carboxyl-terminal processing protease